MSALIRAMKPAGDRAILSIGILPSFSSGRTIHPYASSALAAMTSSVLFALFTA